VVQRTAAKQQQHVCESEQQQHGQSVPGAAGKALQERR
jgi:hypothetical protein